MINCPTAKFCRRKRSSRVEERVWGVGEWWVWLTEGGKLPKSANERGWEHKRSERGREREQRRCWSGGNVTMWQQGDVGGRKKLVGQIEEEEHRELALDSLMCYSSSLDSLKYSLYIQVSLSLSCSVHMCVCSQAQMCESIGSLSSANLLNWTQTFCTWSVENVTMVQSWKDLKWSLKLRRRRGGRNLQAAECVAIFGCVMDRGTDRWVEG